MSTASVNHRRVKGSEKQGAIVDRVAKKALFRILSQLPRGRLVIEDGGEIHEFGQADGVLRAHILIRDPSAYRAMAFGGSIGAGEAYMAGHWSSPNLVDVIRLMAINIDMMNAVDQSRSLGKRLLQRVLHLLNANSLRGSRKNIAAHYDLGNDFFALFLDQSMMYSSAIFPHPQATLEEAARYKLDTVCRKLKLNADDHLLEIGTGWGGLAIHAATHYGCRVTTTTISRQQYEYACAAVRAAGLEDRVSVLLEDYRLLRGQFDKLVSIEMIEAVGHDYYDEYFSSCSALLKPDGLMLIQAITIPDQRFDSASRSVDFIQRYIFPGGSLPSVSVIAGHTAAATDMQIVALEDIGIDYAHTLREWRRRFIDSRDTIRAMNYSEVFCRMWEFYLCYCEGGFLERAISTVQIVFAKPAARDVR